MTSSTPEVPPGPSPRPAIQVSRPATTGETVTIACKLPHGVILRVFEFQEEDEPMRDGSWKRVKRGRVIEGMQFVARGTWMGSAGQAYHRNNPAVAELLPGGYALTPGCPKEIWDRWHEQNQQSSLVRNKIIFAHVSHPTVHEEATNLRAVKSGMEPLDPNKPAERLPGGMDRRLRIGILEHGEGTSPS